MDNIIVDLRLFCFDKWRNTCNGYCADVSVRRGACEWRGAKWWRSARVRWRQQEQLQSREGAGWGGVTGAARGWCRRLSDVGFGAWDRCSCVSCRPRGGGRSKRAWKRRGGWYAKGWIWRGMDVARLSAWRRWRSVWVVEVLHWWCDMRAMEFWTPTLATVIDAKSGWCVYVQIAMIRPNQPVRFIQSL